GTRDDHRRQDPEPFAIAGPKRDAAAEYGAETELAFGADVPDAGAEADGEADADQHQRRRLHRELGPAVERGDRRDDEGVERGTRRLAECREDDGRDDQGRDDRDQRRSPGPEPGMLTARLKPERHWAPPAVRRRPSATRAR